MRDHEGLIKEVGESMLTKLEKRTHKGSWKEMTLLTMFLNTQGELKELEEEVNRYYNSEEEEKEKIIKILTAMKDEATDVCNSSGFIIQKVNDILNTLSNI